MLNSSKACCFVRHGACLFFAQFFFFLSSSDFPRVEKLSVFCPCQSQQPLECP
ncbi:hypothetical protein EXN66_Car012203 [Channa argus]|uniref:Uncharacterized protein n=1 Tax=Channa argus TaxID=215402 RepID=A0A6G1Q1X3_CHAAH|nr:hypothetical protein EXN66_Car012203 [Channa argus]